MILVVGATGHLGGLITRSLLDQGRPVRALVRGASADAAVPAGAQTMVGDLKDPRSLATACRGVSAVVTTANSVGRAGVDTVESVDRRGNHDLVEAAAAAGVQRFVFTSALGASPDSPVPFLRAKADTEKHLRASGMDWTILQPNLFMDTWVPAVVGGPALAGEPVMIVGEGRRRHSFVAARDVAAYAVAALDHPQAVRRVLVIGGPQPLSWHDVVWTFEEALGREVPTLSVPLGTSAPGLPEAVNGVLTALETYDSPLDMTEPSRTFGVPPTTLGDFVRDFVAGAGQVPAQARI
ncbi:SDR family oxidoreductase [Geodermatophilus sp. SYSU D00691]